MMTMMTMMMAVLTQPPPHLNLYTPHLNHNPPPYHFLTFFLPIILIAGTSPTEIVKNSDGTLTMKTDKGDFGPFDSILFATGRVPLVDKLGLGMYAIFLLLIPFNFYPITPLLRVVHSCHSHAPFFLFTIPYHHFIL